MSLQILCSIELKSIAFNHEFVFCLIGMCMCVSKSVSVCCESKEFPLSGLFARPVLGGPRGLLYIARRAAGVILVWLGGVVHLPNDLSEQFVYHGFALGRGLHERAAPLLGQGLTFAGRHLALAFQVHLVPHQDHRNLLVPFHSYDLISHRLYVLEALLVDKAVHQYEPLAVFDVQVPHGGELLGTGGVKDLQHRGRRVHLDLFAVKILYGGVVLLNERPGDKLHGEGGFPDPTAAQDHHFILAHRGIF